MPQQYERTKLRQTNIRLSQLGNELLDGLAEYYGTNKTAVVDLLLREKGRDLGMIGPPPVVSSASDMEDTLEEVLLDGIRLGATVTSPLAQGGCWTPERADGTS